MTQQFIVHSLTARSSACPNHQPATTVLQKWILSLLLPEALESRWQKNKPTFKLPRRFTSCINAKNQDLRTSQGQRHSQSGEGMGWLLVSRFYCNDEDVLILFYQQFLLREPETYCSLQQLEPHKSRSICLMRQLQTAPYRQRDYESATVHNHTYFCLSLVRLQRRSQIHILLLGQRAQRLFSHPRSLVHLMRTLVGFPPLIRFVLGVDQNNQDRLEEVVSVRSWPPERFLCGANKIRHGPDRLLSIVRPICFAPSRSLSIHPLLRSAHLPPYFQICSQRCLCLRPVWLWLCVMSSAGRRPELKKPLRLPRIFSQALSFLLRGSRGPDRTANLPHSTALIPNTTSTATGEKTSSSGKCSYCPIYPQTRVQYLGINELSCCADIMIQSH
ncbi:hypothetical protein XENOCAPTIV_006556 [Xenoophorus captivus]|uniref:Maturase K n=1 Tax=Xenoophorus captivus TaxID=1517983 RepID=A0ABV0QR81_9TELE